MTALVHEHMTLVRPLIRHTEEEWGCEKRCPFGSHLRTLALQTENFSKKIGRFSKTQKWIY